MSLYSIPFYNSLLKKKLYTEKGKDKFANYSHVLVYGAVSIHANGEKGCIASNETIGKEVGMASSTVANCLSEMNKAGWLKVIMKNSARRERIIPKLTIGVLNSSSDSLYKEGSLVNDLPSFGNDTSLLPEVTTLHSGSNIDNSRDNILDNSKNNDWQAIVLHFYSKISPETGLKFKKTTKSSAQHLLTLHSKENIIKKIDWLAASRHRVWCTTFETFCNKYQSFEFDKPKTQPTLYVGFNKPTDTNSKERGPDEF